MIRITYCNQLAAFVFEDEAGAQVKIHDTEVMVGEISALFAKFRLWSIQKTMPIDLLFSDAADEYAHPLPWDAAGAYRPSPRAVEHFTATPVVWAECRHSDSPSWFKKLVRIADDIKQSKTLEIVSGPHVGRKVRVGKGVDRLIHDGAIYEVRASKPPNVVVDDLAYAATEEVNKLYYVAHVAFTGGGPEPHTIAIGQHVSTS